MTVFLCGSMCFDPVPIRGIAMVRVESIKVESTSNLNRTAVVQTRHPRLALLQPWKGVDAGPRRHDGEELTEESIFPTAGITLHTVELHPCRRASPSRSITTICPDRIRATVNRSIPLCIGTDALLNRMIDKP